MPNNKVKSLKGIKGKDTAHPFSRKAYQMRRAVHREQRIETGIDKSKVDKQRKVDKLMFFKQFLNEGGLVLSVIELHNAIKSYINRYANEILELKNQIRPNRPKPSRIEKLELVKSGDESEYKTGFEIPDLTLPGNLHLFTIWNGDYNGMDTAALEIENLDYRAFNRGNKLLNLSSQKENQPSNSIQVNTLIHDETTFQQLEFQRVIMYKSVEMQNNRIVIDPESPYFGINIEDFWGLATREQDLSQMPGAVHTLKDTTLKKYGDMLMIIIEEEKKTHQIISRLGDILLDDDVYMNEELKENPLIIPDALLKEEFACTHSEYLNRLALVRGKLMTIFMKKEELARRVFEGEKE